MISSVWIFEFATRSTWYNTYLYMIILFIMQRFFSDPWCFNINSNGAFEKIRRSVLLIRLLLKEWFLLLILKSCIVTSVYNDKKGCTVFFYWCISNFNNFFAVLLLEVHLSKVYNRYLKIHCLLMLSWNRKNKRKRNITADLKLFLRFYKSKLKKAVSY